MHIPEEASQYMFNLAVEFRILGATVANAGSDLVDCGGRIEAEDKVQVHKRGRKDLITGTCPGIKSASPRRFHLFSSSLLPLPLPLLLFSSNVLFSHILLPWLRKALHSFLCFSITIPVYRLTIYSQWIAISLEQPLMQRSTTVWFIFNPNCLGSDLA